MVDVALYDLYWKAFESLTSNKFVHNEDISKAVYFYVYIENATCNGENLFEKIMLQAHQN